MLQSALSKHRVHACACAQTASRAVCAMHCAKISSTTYQWSFRGRKVWRSYACMYYKHLESTCIGVHENNKCILHCTHGHNTWYCEKLCSALRIAFCDKDLTPDIAQMEYNANVCIWACTRHILLVGSLMVDLHGWLACFDGCPAVMWWENLGKTPLVFWWFYEKVNIS